MKEKINRRFLIIIMSSLFIWIMMAIVVFACVDSNDYATYIVSLLLILIAVPLSFYSGYKFRHRKYKDIANTNKNEKQDIDKMLG